MGILDGDVTRDGVTVRVKARGRSAMSMRGGCAMACVTDDGSIRTLVTGTTSREGLSELLRGCVFAYKRAVEATGMSLADAAQAAADVLAGVFSPEGEGAGHDAA